MTRLKVFLQRLFHYLLPPIVFIFVLLFYFIYTDTGNKTAYSLMSYYASKKAALNIDILEVHLSKYPYVKAKILVEEKYHIDIDGYLHNGNANLTYKLTSLCFQSKVCHFDDLIRIQGKITGWKKKLHITGEGHGLDGNISYKLDKIHNTFKNIHVAFKDINSSKLLTALEQKPFFKGDANITLDFEIIAKQHRIGKLSYEVQDTSFYGLNAYFKANVNVIDNQHTFTMNLHADAVDLNITKGTYDQSKKLAHANYTLDVSDLTALHTLLKGNYTGAFHATGELEHNKKITIKGKSNDLGGELFFIYDSKNVELFFKQLSLETIMQRLHTKPLLSADIIGHAIYTLENKKMQLDTKLKNARLLPSSLTKTIQDKFDYNITHELFDQSSLKIIYQDQHIISSDFILANHNTYLKFKDTQINNTRTSARTLLEIRTPKHALEGKLYLRLDEMGSPNLDELYINYSGTLEKHYTVTLDGLIGHNFINMDYTLQAARLPSPIVTIVDDINLSGHMSGAFNRLHLLGSGSAMDGKVSYSGLKVDNHLESVEVRADDIHALKLFTLLGLADFPNGKADINASLSYIDTDKQEGALSYTLKNGSYQKLPFSLHAHADIHTKQIHFESHSRLANADINITKGIYNLKDNSSQAYYRLTTPNLLSLASIIGTYHGAFSATGKLDYNQTIRIRGLSKTYGGMTDFLYAKDMLIIDLKHNELKKIMRIFDYPPILDAEVDGHINYHYPTQKLSVDTQLNHAKFLDSHLVQTVFYKSGVNMLKEQFNQSTLRAIYQHKVLTGDLMLQNQEGHVYLSSIRMDKNNNTLNGLFDLKLQGQEFSGKIYGNTKHPKIDLDMQKLMRYQMDKQLDSVIGKGNRKLMESIPMGGVAKDMASEVGGGFLDMFF